MASTALVIESGHRRSRAVLVRQGRIELIDDGQSLNRYCYTTSELCERLEELVRRICQMERIDWTIEPLRTLDSIIITLPGGHCEEFRATIANELRQRKWPNVERLLKVEEDAFAGLVAGCGEQIEGVCVYANTGSSVLVVEQEGAPRRRWDGWGPILGDRGGAVRLGLKTLQYLTQCMEQRIPLPACFHDKENRHLTKAVDLVEWFHRLQIQEPYEWRVQMVKVAQIVLEQSRTRKEDWSKGLIAKAAIELADTTATAVRDDEATTADPADASNAKSADDLPIMCQGFMFHRSPTFFDCFCRHLKDKRVVNSVELSKYRPLTGAVLLSANGVDERKALKDAIELLPPDRRAIFRY